jgi:hypothetical protein
MVLGLLGVASRGGELALQPALLVPEAKVVVGSLDWAVGEGDAHLVGQLCRALCVFGAERRREDEGLRALLARGRAYLLRTQAPDGGWRLRDGSCDPYESFCATVSAVAGLCRVRPRGFGPASAELTEAVRVFNSPLGPERPIKPSTVCCGGKKPHIMRKFAGLQEFYRRTAGVRLEGATVWDEVGFPGEMTIGDVAVATLLDNTDVGRANQRFSELLAHLSAQQGPAARAPSPRNALGSLSNRSISDTERFWSRERVRTSAAALKEAAQFARVYTAFVKQRQPGKAVETRVPCGTARVDLYTLYQVGAGARCLLSCGRMQAPPGVCV